jgi:hypothetical protein
VSGRSWNIIAAVLALTDRRFPPPWSIEEQDAYFVGAMQTIRR